MTTTSITGFMHQYHQDGSITFLNTVSVELTLSSSVLNFTYPNPNTPDGSVDPTITVGSDFLGAVFSIQSLNDDEFELSFANLLLEDNTSTTLLSFYDYSSSTEIMFFAEWNGSGSAPVIDSQSTLDAFIAQATGIEYAANSDGEGSTDLATWLNAIVSEDDLLDYSDIDGDVVLEIGAGKDTVLAGDGDDNIFGGGGNDSISGGEGDDELIGARGNDKLFGSHGDDFAYGGAGRDILKGGSGDDFLSGSEGRDRLFGGNGKDELLGGSGADRLFGQKGADTLLGNIGDDILDGGAGNDLLTGGRGADTFVFADGMGNDTITDFADGIDLIDVSTMGFADFAQLEATATISQTGDDVLIEFSDATLLLEDTLLVNLDASDFIL